ncbi:redox-sensitive transcriptional activator SoxR [Aliiroseovarius subalbicans]|uniref:redox-sensitive transcriptional activator SoxR n=1 Tax=Aliiroseovarius subalbicans TaxID=2925840 RepID=UPI001F59FCB7|nr:redox-sensitive transcriptional activator SoxR [Aliiroseovarius subalbicans]MCI2399355.1 redox-sensitive transcriptional activator SoxR [Aliiroseovarius subalbicans]
MAPKAMMSIGQMATRTGLAVSAIRYYEAEGLVRPIRTAGGQRQFHRADIRRLSFVRITQQLGFSIAEIRAQIEKLPDGRTPTKADWTRLARGFRRELDARITAMQQLRDSLDSCIGCGCLSLKRCALYNPADSARRHGPGPRYLMGDRAEGADDPSENVD